MTWSSWLFSCSCASTWCHPREYPVPTQPTTCDQGIPGTYSVRYAVENQDRSVNMNIGCDFSASQPGSFTDSVHFVDVLSQCTESRDATATMFVLNTHGQGKYECLWRNGTSIVGNHYFENGQYWGAVKYELLQPTTCDQAKEVVGILDLPVRFEGLAPQSSWAQTNETTSLVLALDGYLGASEFRACVTYTDAGWGVGALKIRLRHKDGEELFRDSFTTTWSDSELIISRCGAWRSLSSLACGVSYAVSCQVEVQHTQGVSVDIYNYDFELRGSPAGDTYQGRYDIPVWFEGIAPQSSWVQVNSRTSLGLAFDDYPYASDFRACVSYTDSATDGDGLKVRVRYKDGAELFQDAFPTTGSTSELIHTRCGVWRPLSFLSCGFLFGSSCQVEVQHSQGVHVVIFKYGFEIRGFPVLSTYQGRGAARSGHEHGRH
eukprot:gb/GFBE01059340.1/.p1 GENE.gb/GFBE01059340.1/~~gb/GFBE01059340.1/.p1  ORF type:complete len:433 (+),score=34.55 gb/GFBE01059340.1/:1-1299(+)